jgi:16S rRNA (cytosine967-C5)-methyltransferase
VQDEASQVSALLPAPRPGERTFDAAAAPGGKTFALLAAEPSVRPWLADVAPSRIGLLRQNLRRLRRTLPVVAADTGHPPFAAAFDRVVLDLPCSGTGTLRKNPELKWRLTESEIGRLAGQAETLLDRSAPLVTPGGVLVAITCSIEAEENELVGQRFLESHPEFRPRSLEGDLDAEVGAGVEAPGRWRVLPDGDHDGFTVQVFTRAKQH